MDFSSQHHHEPEVPIPITTAYVGLHHHHHHHHPSNGPPNSPSTTTTTTPTTKYRECLKNHAASLGGHAVDGCGEFMPSGEDGTPDALHCSACQCHRNFHRKEVEGGDYQDPFDLYPPPPPQHDNLTTSRKVVGQKGVLISTNGAGHLIPRPTPHQMIVPMMRTSESDEMDVYVHPRAPVAKKRFRTKFTSEQKERMLEFAERVGWRLPRATGEEREVQLFCQEIGVRRRVLKVWMHNNKHTFARKTSLPTTTTTTTTPNTTTTTTPAASAAPPQ